MLAPKNMRLFFIMKAEWCSEMVLKVQIMAVYFIIFLIQSLVSHEAPFCINKVSD